MTDYALDHVLEGLMQSEEAEWKGKPLPTFLPEKDRAAQSENLRRYVTGYPWIVIARDRSDYMSYYCAICKKVANIYHLVGSPCQQNRLQVRRPAGVPHTAMDGKIPGR